MLPFLNMRLYNRNNYMALQPFIEKMKNGQLTLENILEEDEIIQDLKTNQNSQFLSMLSHEAIRKLIDYATKLPQSDDQKIGHKFPFNATELLSCDNCSITDRLLNEIEVAEDSEEEEKEDDEKGENNEDKKDEDDNEEFVEVKEDEGSQDKNKEEGVPNKDEKEKSEETKKEGESKPAEEPKKEENKTEGENKAEEPKKEGETKPTEETEKEGESKPAEEPKKEGENKPAEETKKEEETKPAEETKKEGETKPAEETKKEGETKPAEETKKEEDKKEENKTEGENKPAEEPKKEEETKKEENKTEGENKPTEEPKKDEDKKEENKAERENKPTEETKKEEEGKKEEKSEDEETCQQKHQPKEEEKEDENDNENENQGEEDSERKQPKINIIYDNVDYLLQFLNSSEETKLNYVLVGYFYKILNHLFSYKSSRIIQYLFDYPKKSEFDPLDLLVKNMNRKSMGEIINKLLLFQEENYGDFTQKKMQLFERVLQELKESKEESKYECICTTLESTLYNKGFFIEFMKDGKLIELLYTILEESKDQPRKLIAIMKLLIKINENALKFVDSRVTTPLSQENPMDFINMFSNNYPLDDDVKDPNADTDELVKKMFENTFSALEKNKFNFLEDLDDYSSSENSEFTSTYLVKQKKIGMKKLAQIELFRTLLDILVNANSINNNEEQIKKIVECMNEKKLFWKMHKLFFDFPFSNIYQAFYSQIMDIILNESSPDNLIDFVLIEKGEKEENHLVQKLIDEVLNNMKFTFTVSDSLSFHPNFSFEVSILNKIFNSKNNHLKDLIKDNKNLEVFNTVIGDEVNKIFEQKLLLSENEIQFGSHDDSEEKKPMSYFCKKSFMEVMDEDLDIYKIYTQGGDFNKALEEKREKERIERENMEKEKLDEEKKKMEEDGYFNNEEEETDDKKNDLKGSINMNQDDEEENNEKEENNENNEENENEQRPEENKEDSSTEESEKDKDYNDVNFWRPEVKPNDDILTSILSDLD